jgi:hypothetical protein
MNCAEIGLQFDRDSTSHTEILGYAFPFSKDDSQVHILPDHILRCKFHCFDPLAKISEAAFLGHVMAHEIGHILEGFVRHSNDGLMKAQWTPREMLNMATEPLKFSKEDAELIRLGVLNKFRNAARESGGDGQSANRH